MADWFYAEGDQRLGPVPGSTLKSLAQSGKVTPETLVWTNGAADWVPARSVKGLFPNLSAAAPPPPPPASEAGGMLAYAPAGMIDGSIPPAPFQPPPDDPGPFHKMGRQFTIGKQRWIGKSFVSPYAIYLWKISRNRQTSYGVGGIAGMLISAALTKEDLTRSCDITELPPAVRMQFDPKMKKKQGDIVILNRESLTFVKTNNFLGLVTPMIGAEKFPISAPFLGGKRMRQFMTDNGWTLNYPLQPTAAPMHGRAYGLDYDTAMKRTQKALWKKILYVSIGLLLFIGFVLLRVFAEMHR
jgi:hypothetical protein